MLAWGKRILISDSCTSQYKRSFSFIPSLHMFKFLKKCLYPSSSSAASTNDEYSLPRIIADHEWEDPDLCSYETYCRGYPRSWCFPVPTNTTFSPEYVRAPKRSTQLKAPAKKIPLPVTRRPKPIPEYEGFRSTKPWIRDFSVILLPNAPWANVPLVPKKLKPHHVPAESPSLRPLDYTVRVQEKRRSMRRTRIINAAWKLAASALDFIFCESTN